MKRDDVRRTQELVEREAVAAPVVDHTHSERLRPGSDLRADPSHAYEAECRAGEIAAEQFRLRPAAPPALVANKAIRRDEVAAAGKDQREREVRHGCVENTG